MSERRSRKGASPAQNSDAKLVKAQITRYKQIKRGHRGSFNVFACRPCWLDGKIVELGLSMVAMAPFTTNQMVAKCPNCGYENIYISSYYNHYEGTFKPYGQPRWVPLYLPKIIEYAIQIKRVVKWRDIPNDEQTHFRKIVDTFEERGPECEFCHRGCCEKGQYKCAIIGCLCEHCYTEWKCPCKMCASRITLILEQEEE